MVRTNETQTLQEYEPCVARNLLYVTWKICESTNAVDLHCCFTDLGWLHRAHYGCSARYDVKSLHEICSYKAGVKPFV